MLQMKNGNKLEHLDINVTKGSVWESSDSFLVCHNSLIERRQCDKIVRIAKSQVVKKEESKQAQAETHLLRVEAEECSKHVRMVVMATAYISQNYKLLEQQLITNYQQELNKITSEQHTFDLSGDKNEY